jgi:hypothetical protein
MSFSTETKSSIDQSNQNKVFYHDGVWWSVGRYTGDNDWYLWKLDGGVWVRTTWIDGRSSARADCYLDPATGKLYILNSHKSEPEILRLSYSGGEWTIDPSYPVQVPDFGDEGDHPITMVRDGGGSLWVFQLKNNTLLSQVSTDDGVTWSGSMVLRSGFSEDRGTTDCGVFEMGGVGYVGVAYAEHSGGSVGYGFLYHRDGDGPTAWVDETAQLDYIGQEGPDDELSLSVASDNTI